MDPIDSHLQGYVEGVLDAIGIPYALYQEDDHFNLKIDNTTLSKIAIAFTTMSKSFNEWNVKCYKVDDRFIIKI